MKQHILISPKDERRRSSVGGERLCGGVTREIDDVRAGNRPWPNEVVCLTEQSAHRGSHTRVDREAITGHPRSNHDRIVTSQIQVLGRHV